MNSPLKRKFRISSGQEKPFGDLFTKIAIKLSKEFLFSRNSAKHEMPYLLRSRHEILPRFGAFSKPSGDGLTY